ncbi:rhodanese-like domain-containing protein [Cytophagaceae bacterium DM2B3-1]|uniref:Rhodanese-like domain-containing protein n=1 Tax=Xanthocytophaga flava TaxID=3048013 RepID=A0ABT7CHA5_9BACT|nr:rhodanese-like domain-containing protein [Xanthocytophaga flavus]MDJ1468910.1 rhodanese-like domain-containing protein [Xanthocytophaga flavus]MDJ1492084.1 rhodanese-like domain-containing protein [Xanthocytophaga flavus]
MKLQLLSLFVLVVLLALSVGMTSIQPNETSYVCSPCGYDCDKEEYTKSGKCSHCGMDLVLKSSVNFQNVTPDQLCDITTNNTKVILLDVRTPEEFSGKAKENFGRLKGAINIPIQELDKRIGELNKYKNSEIIVYCSHSHRSPRASYLLTQNGFKNVKNMSGGMSVWNESVKRTPCWTSLLVK